MLGAKQSPRFENHCMYWYDGNTWLVRFQYTAKDGNTPFVPNAADYIKVAIGKEGSRNAIYSWTITNLAPDYFDLEMTPEITKLFPAGSYVMGMTYYGEYIKTICSKYDVKVESSVT